MCRLSEANCFVNEQYIVAPKIVWKVSAFAGLFPCPSLIAVPLVLLLN
uniref:Uncharacterized protein n=1 Tax=Anguilla anguilla TaxID=7936 RepID=A0A0E9QKH0_ANGAN